MSVRNTLSLFFVVAVLTFVTSSQAGICDAKFMHEGGVVQFTGSGNLLLGADLAFSEVSKSNSGNCRARVQGTTTFGYTGLPPGKSRLDHLLSVRNGQITFVPYANAGEKPSNQGQFDLRMLGLFAYDSNITRQGQKLPADSYQFNLGKETPSSALTVRTGEKVVGVKQTQHTVLGPQVCWPIVYTRNSDPIMATFKGLVLPLPGMNTTVTDWFCPAMNLVVKQEINHGGVKSSVEITQIK